MTTEVCPFSMSGASLRQCLGVAAGADTCYAWDSGNQLCRLIEIRASVISKGSDVVSAVNTSTSTITTSIDDNTDELESTLVTQASGVKTLMSTEADDIISAIDTSTTTLNTSIYSQAKETRKRMVGIEADNSFVSDEESSYLLKYTSVLPVLKFMRHEHDEHLHMTPHGVLDYLYDEADPEEEPRGCNFGPSYSPAVMLMQEYISNIDLDANGKIYGKDFKISNSDTDKPSMLNGLEQQPAWRNPPSENNMTWLEYLEEIGWNNGLAT